MRAFFATATPWQYRSSAAMLTICGIWAAHGLDLSPVISTAHAADGGVGQSVRGPAMVQLAAGNSGIEGLWLWVVERQRELTLGMTNAVKRFKTEDFWGATLQLAIVSFVYGVFHAAGPGHGKFIISSYALANAQTLRRGVAVSFMAAMVQACSAIVLVGVLALLLKATSLEIRQTEAWLETLSWALVACVGAWLLYRSVTAFRSLQPKGAPLPSAAHDHPAHLGHDHQHAHDHQHQHDHHHHDGHKHAHRTANQPAMADAGHIHRHEPHGHGAAHHQGDHAHGHGHGNHKHDHDHTHAEGDACADCGHVHMAAPSQLAGNWSWREAWSLAFAIGVRPCTGAIAVLIFALGIGLFSAGIFAAFAMAIGTALTVSALAILAVTSRDLAVKIAGDDSILGGRLMSGAAVLGSGLVFVLGAAFFVASLQGSGPL